MDSLIHFREKGPARSFGVDPSTKKIAWAIVDSGSTPSLLAYGKFDLPKIKSERFRMIGSSLPVLLNAYKPSKVVIEETIFIQSPIASRELAYIVGCLWSTALACVENVYDMGPIAWKREIGYQNVTKKEKQLWTEEIGEKEAKKKANFERKERVKQILIPIFSQVASIDDDDVVDAIGIAYASLNYG